MNAALIVTPTDMRGFVGSHDSVVSQLGPLKPELEPTMRHAVDAIFHQDLQYIGADEPQLVSCYLDDIAKPLETLREHGMAILAISSKGTYKFLNGASMPNWTRTYFLIVPTLGYFRVQQEGRRVHRFCPSCDVAMSDLLQAAKSEEGIGIYVLAKPILEEFQNDVPWCESCCLNEIISICGSGASVKTPELRITSDLVERAIADAETLLRSAGPTSAVDRVHTALHGYLMTVCADKEIQYAKDPSITQLFKVLRQSHPSLKDLGVHQSPIVQVLRSLGSVVDALNPARNRGSMAHPNEELLDNEEATLFINAARTILQYLDAKFSEGGEGGGEGGDRPLKTRRNE
jgi:hypothetical protein